MILNGLLEIIEVHHMPRKACSYTIQLHEFMGLQSEFQLTAPPTFLGFDEAFNKPRNMQSTQPTVGFRIGLLWSVSKHNVLVFRIRGDLLKGLEDAPLFPEYLEDGGKEEQQ